MTAVERGEVARVHDPAMIEAVIGRSLVRRALKAPTGSWSPKSTRSGPWSRTGKRPANAWCYGHGSPTRFK